MKDFIIGCHYYLLINRNGLADEWLGLVFDIMFGSDHSNYYFPRPDQFLFIKPNKTLKVAVDPAQPEAVIEIPKELQNKNLMLEVFAWGLRRSTVS